MHDDDAACQFEPVRDIRHLQRGRYEGDSPGDITTRMIGRKINALHCRLLERATGWRLTWSGDTIVRYRKDPVSPDLHNPPKVLQTSQVLHIKPQSLLIT